MLEAGLQDQTTYEFSFDEHLLISSGRTGGSAEQRLLISTGDYTGPRVVRSAPRAFQSAWPLSEPWWGRFGVEGRLRVRLVRKTQTQRFPTQTCHVGHVSITQPNSVVNTDEKNSRGLKGTWALVTKIGEHSSKT